jgi:hypothetical protein
MSSIRLLQLSFVVLIAFIYGYLVSLSIIAVMLGLGLDIVVASTTALIVSTYSTLLVSDYIESFAEKITCNIYRIKSFFKQKKEEFDTKAFNLKNGIVSIS